MVAPGVGIIFAGDTQNGARERLSACLGRCISARLRAIESPLSALVSPAAHATRLHHYPSRRRGPRRSHRGDPPRSVAGSAEPGLQARHAHRTCGAMLAAECTRTLLMTANGHKTSWEDVTPLLLIACSLWRTVRV